MTMAELRSMRAENRALRRALLAMFIEAEQVAVTSYETCTYPGGIFDDDVWKKNDGPGFRIAKQARTVLGLPAFAHRDKKRFGGADDALVAFRKEAC